MPDYTIASVVNTPSDQVVNRTGNNQMTGVNKFGSTTDYTQFDTRGNMTMVGNARPYRDEKNDVLNIKVQGTGLSVDATESTLDFTTAANLSDYGYVNVQLNHDRDELEPVYPHIHWFQNNNASPNFLLEYRWNLNGKSKVTAWTRIKCNTLAFTYVSGTLNQISYTSPISAPSGSDVSDIIQFRIYRDNANTSTLFTGADAYTGDAELVSFDVHVEINSVGSDEEYVK